MGRPALVPLAWVAAILFGTIGVWLTWGGGWMFAVAVVARVGMGPDGCPGIPSVPTGAATLALGLLHVGAPLALYRNPAAGRLGMQALSGVNVLVSAGLAAGLGEGPSDPFVWAFAGLLAVNVAAFVLFRRRELAEWWGRARPKP